MKHHKFTVAGHGRFPFDMLRYDCCYPASPQDVSKLMILSMPVDGRESHEVTLIAAKPIGPTEGRWSSFGWTVTKQEVLR